MKFKFSKEKQQCSYLRGWAVGPHAAGVWAQVTILKPFVILRWRHRRDCGTVTETQTLQEKQPVKFSSPTYIHLCYRQSTTGVVLKVVDSQILPLPLKAPQLPPSPLRLQTLCPVNHNDKKIYLWTWWKCWNWKVWLPSKKKKKPERISGKNPDCVPEAAVLLNRQNKQQLKLLQCFFLFWDERRKSSFQPRNIVANYIWLFNPLWSRSLPVSYLHNVHHSLTGLVLVSCHNNSFPCCKSARLHHQRRKLGSEDPRQCDKLRDAW